MNLKISIVQHIASKKENTEKRFFALSLFLYPPSLSPQTNKKQNNWKKYSSIINKKWLSREETTEETSTEEVTLIVLGRFVAERIVWKMLDDLENLCPLFHRCSSTAKAIPKDKAIKRFLVRYVDCIANPL